MFIYADNAATTKMSESVFEAMTPYLKEEYGNPSSIYSIGANSRRAIEKAREQVATAIGATSKELYFTGSGTEADNWVLKVISKQMKKRGKPHIITTAFEHHAVLHCCEFLEKDGYEVTYLPVSSDGHVTAQQVADAITERTGLVSVMYANNEIGTIQPIAEIGKICREKGVLFHTDAVQALGSVEIDVEKQNIDLLSISAHKVYGPKGVGALYVRKGIPLFSYMHGGAQERNKRGATENVAGIVGFGVAAEERVRGLKERSELIAQKRDKLIDGIIKAVPKCQLNGSMNRLCGSVNISFEAIEGEGLLLHLDMRGICASSGSACTSGSLDPSHVLMAIGLSHEIAHGSLRLTINEHLTDEEIDYIVQEVPKVVSLLRAMSPIWEE